MTEPIRRWRFQNARGDQGRISDVDLVDSDEASPLPTTSASASHTPNPTSVTVAGSHQERRVARVTGTQSCATTHVATAPTTTHSGDARRPPAGHYEYMAPLNDAWDENYGLHAALDGANTPFKPAIITSVVPNATPR